MTSDEFSQQCLMKVTVILNRIVEMFYKIIHGTANLWAYEK
jgi:hypothetical protein